MWPQIPLVAQNHTGPIGILVVVATLTGILGIFGVWLLRRLQTDGDEKDPSA